MARVTRLELATSGVTGRRSNQLSYTPIFRPVVPEPDPLEKVLSGKTRPADCQACPPLLSKEKLNGPMRSKRMGMQRVKPHEHVIARGAKTAVWQQGLWGKEWWVVRGSNPRPTRCKRVALPAELTTHIASHSATENADPYIGPAFKKIAKN